MARENKGYYAWAKEARYEAYRALRHRENYCRMCDSRPDMQHVVKNIFEMGLALHPLFDLTFEAFARAESRLGLRFVPQRSNEERLTGHLVSELEAAIHLAAPTFCQIAQTRYGRDKKLDFAYQDLSQGGPLKKLTGGDFGLIVSVDLPDKPKAVRTAAFQAKKLVDGKAQIPKIQFATLTENFASAAYYVFYDTDYSSLAPPLILSASALEQKAKEDETTKTFSVTSDFVFSNGLPLSLWFLTQFCQGNAGKVFSSFKNAFQEMQANRWKAPAFTDQESPDSFNITRLAMVSLGGHFDLEFNNDRQQIVVLNT